MASTQDFKDAFEDENVDLNDVMADSVKSLGVQYKMTASDLAGEYVMFLINRHDNNFELNPGRLEQFTMFLQDENKKKKVESDSTNDFHLYSRDDLDNLTEVAMDPFKQHPEPIRSRPFSSTDKMAPGTPGAAPGTPGRSPGGSNWKSPAATHAYSERPQRNVVQVALNEHIPRSDASVTPMNVDSGVTQQRVQVEILEGGLKPGTRFMYEQLQDTVSAMEERILAFADALKDQHGIAEFMPVHTATQEKAVIVGRVVCDGEGRLNASAVLLEGSVKQSGGRRIRLELRDIPHFSLFPGQIIAAEGFNPSGHCFTVTRLYTSCPAPMATTPSNELAATSAISTSTQPLSIVIAAGPFCCSEDMDYTPLRDLLRYVRDHNADALLLVGPFVDTDHPHVKSGALEVTFDDLFAQAVQTQVEDACDEMPDLKVLLVPSVRDAHTDMVYPQPPLDLADFKATPGQVIAVGNPGAVRLNEVVIGLSSHDFVKHLGANEAFCTNVKGEDRMSRLAAHAIAQRSYYPLYPPPKGSSIDTSLMHAARMQVTPDILVLPSDLSACAKVISIANADKAADKAADKENDDKAGGRQDMETDVSSTAAPAEATTDASTDATIDAASQVLYINPGRFTKGSSAGTCVHVHLQPPSHDDAKAEGQLHSVCKRARVEIVRI